MVQPVQWTRGSKQYKELSRKSNSVEDADWIELDDNFADNEDYFNDPDQKVNDYFYGATEDDLDDPQFWIDRL